MNPELDLGDDFPAEGFLKPPDDLMAQRPELLLPHHVLDLNHQTIADERDRGGAVGNLLPYRDRPRRARKLFICNAVRRELQLREDTASPLHG